MVYGREIKNLGLRPNWAIGVLEYWVMVKIMQV